MQYTPHTSGPQDLRLPAGPSSVLQVIAPLAPAQFAYFEAATHTCSFANEQYATCHGHTPASIIGKTLRQATGEATWKMVQAHVARAMQGEHVQYVREQTLPSGEVRTVEVSLIPHLDDAKNPLGTFVLINDITGHWQAEQAVRKSEERMRKFAAATDEALVFHRDGVILDGNEALQRLTGYSLAEVQGRSAMGFLSPRFHALATAHIRQGYDHAYEAAIIHRDGHEIPVEIIGKAMPQQDGNYRITVLRDISARQAAQQREAFLALHDTLTQLPNRRHLIETLDTTVAQARARGTKVAVLFIDLDHFKTVNESLGHDAGDALLCEVARRLRSCVAQGDLVARLGSDEFVLLLTGPGCRERAASMADQVLQTVGQSVTINGTTLDLSLSIGISICPDDGHDADALLRHADAARYHAKESGRGNRQFYTPGMDGHAMEVLQRERLLREAIASASFVLHYQPQVRLSDGALVGFEALVRWQHPERGLVGPNEFIGFAEARGLITPIGRWVLNAACRQLKAWQNDGLAQVPVAVNLSALEFRQRDMAAEIAAVLQATGLAPRFLEIELTESVLMHHTGQALETLNALKALGVGISIDDFGTGYSSLAYLKRYPIDKLKIDRSFVMDTPGDADDVAIVTAIVQMARSLQLQTVAEGAETVEQLALLRQLGCDQAQGYAISRPMDVQQATAWLRARGTGGQYAHAPDL